MARFFYGFLIPNQYVILRLYYIKYRIARLEKIAPSEEVPVE